MTTDHTRVFLSPQWLLGPYYQPLFFLYLIINFVNILYLAIFYHLLEMIYYFR